MCYNFVNGLRLKLLFVFIRGIRTIHPDVDRIYSFSKRSENYFQLFKSSAGTTSLSTLPYLHYLRNHTGGLNDPSFQLVWMAHPNIGGTVCFAVMLVSI